MMTIDPLTAQAAPFNTAAEEAASLEQRLILEVNTLMQGVARAFLESGFDVYFRPNTSTHWGEGDFGRLTVVSRDPEHLREAEAWAKDLSQAFHEYICLRIAAQPDKFSGEPVTLGTLRQIAYPAP
ncbi:MAG: hypothetical protein HZA23_05820 [Nitrospirae bacterium]|nr:hypothetical protein [Nitrospirota bacterium]